jgi:hypothetical protein
MTAARLGRQSMALGLSCPGACRAGFAVPCSRSAAYRVRFAVGQRLHALDYPRSKAIRKERLRGGGVVSRERSRVAIEKIPSTKTANPKDFTDTKFLEELDRSGFIDQLYK